MATPYKIVLAEEDIGNIQHGGYRAANYAKASELLQYNLENWTIIFMGLRHNHIVHCILNMLALGTTPEELQMAYDREASYQKPRYPIHEDNVNSMADRTKFPTFLSQQPFYSDFLIFFQQEIAAKGVKATLEEHVFAGDEYANRIFALFYGEQLAGGPRQHGKKTLHEIMETMRSNEVVRASTDGQNPIDRSKNVLDNATQAVVELASQYSISEEQLEERMYEIIDICPLLIASKPSPIKESEPYKIDFFLLHSVNTLAMLPSLVKHPWISRDNAIRMTEWAGRCHLLNYVAQTSPPITTAEIEQYPLKRNWEEVFYYANNHPSDDGHLGKCIRSLALGEKLWTSKESSDGRQIKPEQWAQLANLVVDLVPWEASSSEQRWLLKF